MADAVWLVGREGQQFGPFTTDDLRAKLARGEFETQCRDCGCDLVLSPVTGRWRFSGVMG